MYAIHLSPNDSGSSYTATKEEFLSGSPLPVSDALIHPRDGAMYFTIGGRRVQSGLYRVTYNGSESTAAVEKKPTHSAGRDLRRELEAFHGVENPQAITMHGHISTIRTASSAGPPAPRSNISRWLRGATRHWPKPIRRNRWKHC
jgi:hypothetical protein